MTKSTETALRQTQILIHQDELFYRFLSPTKGLGHCFQCSEKKTFELLNYLDRIQKKMVFLKISLRVTELRLSQGSCEEWGDLNSEGPSMSVHGPSQAV